MVAAVAGMEAPVAEEAALGNRPADVAGVEGTDRLHAGRVVGWQAIQEHLHLHRPIDSESVVFVAADTVGPEAETPAAVEDRAGQIEVVEECIPEERLFHLAAEAGASDPEADTVSLVEEDTVVAAVDILAAAVDILVAVHNLLRTAVAVVAASTPAAATEATRTVPSENTERLLVRLARLRTRSQWYSLLDPISLRGKEKQKET